MVIIHINPHLPHQVEHGEILSAGLAVHGVASIVTHDPRAEGEIHIVSGPHYALEQWRAHPRTLWLDRCFYGDAHDIVSIGWLNPDGSRDFRNANKTEPKGELPEVLPLRSKLRCCVVFGDYGRDPKPELKLARQKYDSVWFRPHPADTKLSPYLPLRGELNTIWQIADAAIGHSSTVLVDAVIHGLYAESTDPRHVINGMTYRSEWLNRLSWCQWSLEEIRRGEFWEHLC